MKPRRYIIFYAIFAIVIVVLSMRLVNLQIANGAYYREKSDTRTVRSVSLFAPRGEILDRNGRPIVANRTAYNVYILSDRNRTADKLNRLVYDLSRTITGYSEYVKSIFPMKKGSMNILSRLNRNLLTDGKKITVLIKKTMQKE